MKIHFKGEHAQDGGGLLKEFIHLIFKEATSEDSSIFIPHTNENGIYYSMHKEGIPEVCSFIGALYAKAIMEEIPVGFNLCGFMVKTLLQQDFTLRDL